MKAILALDQGTTSSRAILYGPEGETLASAQKEFRQIFPQPGWVEHDPEEIWETQIAVAREALSKAGLKFGGVAAIGITNQRETTVVWDRLTGAPVSNAIVWQDRRTSGYCGELLAAGHGQTIQDKTGLVLDAYFSATKIRWILDRDPDLRARAARGELAFGTIDTWLVWKLTEGHRHLTDASNASRTLLYNLGSDAWDESLLELFAIPAEILPTIGDSSGPLAETSPRVTETSIPIAGIAGDQQAALFGQTCWEKGMAKNTYGTGCFMLLNTGPEKQTSRNRLLSTVAWRIGGQRMFALEGSVFIAGAVVQWLRDGLGIIRESSEIEPLARKVEDNGGVYLVPAFSGLGAPHWDAYARGGVLGLTRGTTAGHLARAALEGIAFQVAEVLEAMHRDSGAELSELRVDGGAAANDLLLQFQADLLGIPIRRPKNVESTAVGAAYLAGLAVDYWKDRDSIARRVEWDREFLPSISREEATDLRAHWTRAVDRCREWAAEE
jgi:glycerol kinase